MRVELPGVHRTNAPIAFNFDGRRIEAHAGESLAAALIAAGEWATRETRSGESRGLFCGMGVCGECLILVNGVPRRACVEPVSAGLNVAHHPPRAPLSTMHIPFTPATKPGAFVSPDVLVIGAGPGGLAAARVAAESGLDVVIVDERKSAGGQYFKQPGVAFEIQPSLLDAQFREGRELSSAITTTGGTLITEATVWGAFAPLTIGAITPKGPLTFQPKRLILACGAYERGVPVPGWTLPGVITTGAAQTLLRASQVTPGRRIMIAGNGPLNLQVARELTDVGVEVVALAESAPAPRISHALPIAKMAMSAPRLLLEGVGHTLNLKRRGIPIFHRHALVRVEGATRVESAVIARIDSSGVPVKGTERRYSVDAVCMGYGFLPQNELARSLGCRHDYDAARGTLVVHRDEECRTTHPSVFVVGDAGGLGGARIALSQGTLAGAAAARDLGNRPNSAQLRILETAHRTLLRHRRFQSALWSLYRAPLLTDQLAAPDTQICRCEGIDKQTVMTHVAREIETVGALKRVTRAGMGRCQGRYCGPVIADMIRRRRGEPLTETDLFAPRPPVRPVSIGALASACSTVDD